jgi:hypothetical protein
LTPPYAPPPAGPFGPPIAPPIAPAAKKGGSGCAKALLVAFLAVAALGVLGMGVALAIVLTGGEESSSGSPSGSAAAGDRRSSVPTPMGADHDRDVTVAIHAGSCRRNDTHRRKPNYFTGMRGRGSAGALRGKVAIVHLKVSTTGGSWTPATSRSVTLTAATARDFIVREAKRYQVRDLVVDAIEWPVSTRLTLPPIRLDAQDKVSTADGEALRKQTRQAVEIALGRSLQAVVEDLRKEGYAETGFIVHYPTGPRGIRDFAVPNGSPRKDAEFAYLLEPDWNVASRSALAVHEILHLFGADDLYEVVGLAADEVNDIMNAQCDGLGPAHVGETTAYGVGWVDRPPKRAYGFSDR